MHLNPPPLNLMSFHKYYIFNIFITFTCTCIYITVQCMSCFKNFAVLLKFLWIRNFKVIAAKRAKVICLHFDQWVSGDVFLHLFWMRFCIILYHCLWNEIFSSFLIYLMCLFFMLMDRAYRTFLVLSKWQFLTRRRQTGRAYPRKTQKINILFN